MDGSELIMAGKLVGFTHQGERYVGKVVQHNEMVAVVSAQGQDFIVNPQSLVPTEDDLDVVWYRQFEDGCGIRNAWGAFETPLDCAMEEEGEEDKQVEGDNVSSSTDKGYYEQLLSYNLSRQLSEIPREESRGKGRWRDRVRGYIRSLLQAKGPHGEDNTGGV